MAHSVQEALQARLRRLQPTVAQLERLGRRRTSIQARLEETFGIRPCMPAGSYSRRTALATSDLDLFAIVPRRELVWGDGSIGPATFLRRVRNDLRTRFPSSTVVIDGQVVVIEFADGDRIEVVPAIFDRFVDKSPIYLIADTGGEWIETAPGLHKRYLDDAADRSLGKLPRLAQLLKYWARGRETSLPVQSFYLEVFLARTRVAEGVKSYSQAMTDALETLLRHEARSIDDPCGISGRLRAVKTVPQREALVEALKVSFKQARRALEANDDGNAQEARQRWRRVFRD